MSNFVFSDPGSEENEISRVAFCRLKTPIRVWEDTVVVPFGLPSGTYAKREGERREQVVEQGSTWTLTVEEAAKLLGISRTLAYELVTRGELPSLRKTGGEEELKGGTKGEWRQFNLHRNERRVGGR